MSELTVASMCVGSFCSAEGLLCVLCVSRDQSGDGREPCGHRQYSAVPSDAQVLEGQASGLKETGTRKFISAFVLIILYFIIGLQQAVLLMLCRF